MFYPAYINLQNRKCLVVGGGTVAERKVVSLLLSGGEVTLISPAATALLAFLAHIGKIFWHKRQVEAGDTCGYFLVCAATDSTVMNTAVFAEAHEENKIRLVNVVDVIPQCTFAAASVVTDGELMVSISTSGKSPATSRRIREYLEHMLGATSLYTLGYQNGKPVPIEDEGLPYPVYLLLENRKCIVLCEQKTPEIERRVSLLRQCGASVLCMAPDEMTKESTPMDSAFLVITDKFSAVDIPCESEATFMREYLDAPDAGTYFTPNLIIDGNLIISVSARDSTDIGKAKWLHKSLANQFENNGYGAFIEFLGMRRPEILKAFPTPKARADFFETLISNVEDEASGNGNIPRKRGKIPLQTPPTTCCLGLTNPECSAECLFNWVRHGKLARANTFTTALLEAHTAKM